jgi:hypothetical protein
MRVHQTRIKIESQSPHTLAAKRPRLELGTSDYLPPAVILRCF